MMQSQFLYLACARRRTAIPNFLPALDQVSTLFNPTLFLELYFELFGDSLRRSFG